MFHHGDIGPTNVLVDRDNNDSIGVVDWEYAGFVPEAYVPLHVWTSAGYNLDLKGYNLDPKSPTYARRLRNALVNVEGFVFPSRWLEEYLAQNPVLAPRKKPVK